MCVEEKKFCFTPKDVYGEKWWAEFSPRLAEWEWEFKLPQYDEEFLVKTSEWRRGILSSYATFPTPRIVLLHKKDPIKEAYGKTLEELKAILPADYEFTGEFRQANCGELFFTSNAFPKALSVRIWKPECTTADKYLIVRPTDPIAKVYGKPFSELTAPEGWEFTGEFRRIQIGDTWLRRETGTAVGPSAFNDSSTNPLRCTRLILRRAAPKVPQLKDYYNSETVTIPAGYTWTGEFRKCRDNEHFLYGTGGGKVIYAHNPGSCDALILKPSTCFRFLAEATSRPPKINDWYLLPKSEKWLQAYHDWVSVRFICATRHEEPTPAYTLTQADIDAHFANNKKG